MSKRDDNPEQLFTELFAHARPRARISREHAGQIFTTLHEEWQQQLRSGKKKALRSWALAASVALVLVAGTALFFQNQSVDSQALVKVATLSRTVGDELQLITAQGSHPVDSTNAQIYVSGQRLRSGAHSRAAVDLVFGGSLRIDENTLIGFNADHSVQLLNGRVYFDSGFAPGTAPIYPLQEKLFFLSTAFGEVHHKGTQFSVQTRPDHMVVNVREGEVAIINEAGRIAVSAGSRVVVDGSGTTRTQRISRFDEEWAWTQKIIPPPDFERPRVAEFLSWVERETGLVVVYHDARTRNIAETARSVGTVNQAPREALAVRLQSVGLDYEIRDNQVIVRMIQ